MHELGNRNSSLVKRKIPDTFYAPPVLKTQVFSSNELTQSPQHKLPLRAHINHSHTNSLPVDTMHPAFNPTQSNLHPTGSVNNLTELNPNASLFNTTPMKSQIQQQQQHQQSMYASYSPMHLTNENTKVNQSNYVNQSQHAKTYSLPVSFDPQQADSYAQLQPPIRNKHLGDIPLPEGYTYETTPSGQIYFINHITKTTQWHDPRSYYNLPMNQNEMSKDLRANITNSIPLPPNWEEARTPAGEVYYINHSNQTTTWSDPRLSIYMQQENLKYSNQNANINSKLNNASNSSLYSPYSSSASSINAETTSSSSTTSLNTMNQATNNQYDFSHQQQQQQLISNLKKSLDILLNKKYQICKELDELSKKEIALKSKLNQQDLDDVLRLLKTNDTSMSSFCQYEANNSGSNTSNTSNVAGTSSNPQQQNSASKLDKLNNTDTELDATLVVGDNSTLNTSNL